MKKWILGSVIMVMILALAVLKLDYAAMTRANDASALLKAASRLRIGEKNVEQILKLKQEFPSYGSPSGLCRGTRCLFSFDIGNPSLSRWRLAPPTHFQLLLATADGILIEKTVTLESRISYQCCQAHIHQSEPTDVTQGAGLHVTPKEDGISKVNALLVELGPNADDSQEHLAFAVNTSCLYRIGGCGDARQLLPGVYPYKQ